MTEFAFRLRFRFPSQSLIAEDAETLAMTILPGNQQITLQSRPSSRLVDANLLDAVGQGFGSLDAAISYGRKTREALVISCALLGLGVEIDRHEEFYDSSQVQTGANGQPYIQPGNLKGLIVYPQQARIEKVTVELSAKGGPQGEKFEKVFNRAIQLTDNLDARLDLAFELYNSHLFETSIRSRFLQLVSAIECLATPQRESSIVIEQIDHLIEMTEQRISCLSGTPSDELEGLVQRLGNLKRESIARACRHLIHSALDDDAADSFSKLYGIRSKLSHQGDIPSGTPLVEHYWELETLTRDLLYALIYKADSG